MPEVLTKHPEVVIKVLEGAGVRCGPGQQQKILTKCPPSRFCSTPAGETCVYGVDQVTQMTQIDRAELAKLVCASKTAGGCSANAVHPSSVPALVGVLAFGIACVMLRRLGRGDQMREAYHRALPFADNEQVRRFIEQRLRSQ